MSTLHSQKHLRQLENIICRKVLKMYRRSWPPLYDIIFSSQTGAFSFLFEIEPPGFVKMMESYDRGKIIIMELSQKISIEWLQYTPTNMYRCRTIYHAECY